MKMEKTTTAKCPRNINFHYLFVQKQQSVRQRFYLWRLWYLSHSVATSNVNNQINTFSCVWRYKILSKRVFKNRNKLMPRKSNRRLAFRGNSKRDAERVSTICQVNKKITTMKTKAVMEKHTTFFHFLTANHHCERTPKIYSTTVFFWMTRQSED